ncbi:hypothetical protein B0H19DRAFT_1059027 [Mycena capillaripes]|nr:hypothetical protein B0H19DRAFT_1059027 [Mycena capillaripes]
MEGPPSAKRQRSDDSNPAETTRAVDRILVESTQFRLTKSMLATHFSVFRDMITMPLPTDEPTVENCPIAILWRHRSGLDSSFRGHVSQVLDDKDPILSTIDRLACMQGYVKLIKLQSRTTMAWLDVGKAHNPANNCPQKLECSIALKESIIRDMATPPSRDRRPRRMASLVGNGSKRMLGQAAFGFWTPRLGKTEVERL